MSFIYEDKYNRTTKCMEDKVVIMQVHAPSVLRWVHNACFDTTKIHVDSFEHCFASRIAHNYT